MTHLDVTDPAALAAALEAVLPGTWVDVVNDAGTFRVRRVPGGWYLPGDLAVTSGDVVDGEPVSITVLASAPPATPGAAAS